MCESGRAYSETVGLTSLPATGASQPRYRASSPCTPFALSCRAGSTGQASDSVYVDRPTGPPGRIGRGRPFGGVPYHTRWLWSVGRLRCLGTPIDSSTIESGLNEVPLQAEASRETAPDRPGSARDSEGFQAVVSPGIGCVIRRDRFVVIFRDTGFTPVRCTCGVPGSRAGVRVHRQTSHLSGAVTHAGLSDVVLSVSVSSTVTR